MDFVNIDLIEKLKKRKIALKKGAYVAVIALELGMTAPIGQQANAEENHTTVFEEIYGSEYQKVYGSYTIMANDTLDSIADKILEEYEYTKYYLTKDEIINEIIRTNHLGDNIVEGDYGKLIMFPYYFSTRELEDNTRKREELEEKASMMDDYQQYTVKTGDSYWSLARMYTTDNNEIIALVNKIQRLNDFDNLIVGEVITIPNLSKYQLLNSIENENEIKSL
ncbi:MAG TPA: LysM peptidoglycan-binding domain-containing protein [Bacilli bacterium]|nr:LysM peptidoglycan-binding domain-containing protein [Bacilli bacterium]